MERSLRGLREPAGREQSLEQLGAALNDAFFFRAFAAHASLEQLAQVFADLGVRYIFVFDSTFLRASEHVCYNFCAHMRALPADRWAELSAGTVERMAVWLAKGKSLPRHVLNCCLLFNQMIIDTL